MKTPKYNIEQRTMALNWFSNLASNKFGTAEVLQEDLRQTLEKIFKDPVFIDLIGEWTLEWGPVVVEEGWDSNKYYHVATNAMFVARQKEYNGKNDHYVIAIAGTNALSLYGWFIEDFKTDEMVLWKNAGQFNDNGVLVPNCVSSTDEPAAPRISKGTCTGLTTLLGMEWQPVNSSRKLLVKKTTPSGDRQNLLQFLQERFGGTAAPADLITVTGHSLGGALSASLALRLAELQWDASDPKKPNLWNPSHTVTLTAMPTAGASPGNKAFSEYYGNVMGMKTNRVWNRMDPVPYGHQPDMLRFMPQLYYPFIIPDAGVYGFADYLLSSSLRGVWPTRKEGGYYTQLMPQTAGMNGQFNSVSAPIPPGLILRFCADVFYGKLLELIGVPKPMIEKILVVINDIIKVEGWLGIQGALLDQIYKAITKLFGGGDGVLAERVMRVVRFAFDNVQSLFGFLGQLGYQHVWAYPDLMNMDGFQKAVKPFMKDDQSHDDFEKMLRYAKEYLEKVWTHIFSKEMLQQNGLM